MLNVNLMHLQPVESSGCLGSNVFVLTAENEVHLPNEFQSAFRLKEFWEVLPRGKDILKKPQQAAKTLLPTFSKKFLEL